MCTQRASGLWSRVPPADSSSLILDSVFDDPQKNLLKLHREDKPESNAEIFVFDEKPDKGGAITRWLQQIWKLQEGKPSQALLECDHSNIEQPKALETSGSISTSDRARNDSGYCVSIDEKRVEDRAQELKDNLQHQTCDPGVARDEGLTKDQSAKSQNASSCIESKEGIQPKQESAASVEKEVTTGGYTLGYFTGKLTEVYKDAGRRLQGTRDMVQNTRDMIQGTRDIIRNVGVGSMKDVLSQYVTMMSKELPLIQQIHPKQEPEPSAENKPTLLDSSNDRGLGCPQKCSVPAIPGVSGWPKGSVSRLRVTSPDMFHQRLVQLPPALSQLQTLSTQRILEKLEYLAPHVEIREVLSIFWIKTANKKQPSPKPGCLVLSQNDLIVLSSGTNLDQSVSVAHHFNLLEIKNVQISLAGQHLRLIGETEDSVLAVFTHSKELTQKFCKALLKVLSPERFSEGTKDHPLLSGDLMTLSLDWTSNVPDIILDSGLHVTSRFKRILADLLYIVHGNMDSPGKPSLANICPLLYTSVKVMNSARVHQDTIFQFLLTDTHVALLREDGVFHPVPRGSSLVPSQPQFQGLEIRRRADIKCVLVRQNDDWLVVEISFMNGRGREKKIQVMRGAAKGTSDRGSCCDSWKLSFGCTSEAVTLISHLGT